LHLKNNELSTPHTRKLSKGVSKIILKFRMESSIVYSFLVHAHNLQILRIEQGSTPRIDRSFLATLLLVAIASVKRGTLSFSHLSPHHDQFFRPLNLINVSVPIVRRRDATPPSFSATILTTPRHHGLTLLSSVLSTPDTRLVK
jgi:hypothetical protein